MNEQVKIQIEKLAKSLLNLGSASCSSDKVNKALKKKYGISLSNFQALVWDLMDYTPILNYGNDDCNKMSHVLGLEVDTTTKNNLFFAIVTKDVEYNNFRDNEDE